MKNKLLNKKIINIFLLVLVTGLVLLLPTRSHAMEPVWQVLKNYQDTSSLGGKVYGIWNIFIKLTNGFVVVVLIAVAFAQILRLNINTYGVKKILPTLVLAVIAANFSFLFCRLLVDFASVVMSIFVQGYDGTKTNASQVTGALSEIAKNLTMPPTPCTGSTSDTPGIGCYTFGTILWHGLANLMAMAGAILILILAYLFIIRNWVIYFFVSLAPLAIMSLVLPQTKSLFNQWWTNLSKWIFLPVVSLFWIWVGSLWFSNIGAQGTLMSFVFAGVCFYLAITTPFKMGGAIMSAWGNLGKKAWGKTGGAIGKQVGWAASGGIASTMALRNQLRAKQLKAEGKDTEAKKYETKANRWTWVNPQALKGGIKGRIETRRSAIEGAPKKTAYYNRLLGAGATIRAGVESNKADWSVMSPEQIGSTARNLLNDPRSGVWGKLSNNMRDRFTREARDPANAREMDKLGYVAGQEGQYAQHRFLQFMAKENPDALGNEIKLGSGEYFNLGNLQAGAQEYIRMSRGNQQVRERAVGSFVSTSAVGTPSGGEVNAQNMAANVGQLDVIAGPDREKVIHAALIGLDFDPSTITSHTDPNNMKELQKSFDAIKGRRTELIEEISKSVEDYIEDVGVGLERTGSYFKQGHHKLPKLEELDEQLAGLKSPDETKRKSALEYAKAFSPSSGLEVGIFTLAKAQKALEQTHKAISAVDNINTRNLLEPKHKMIEISGEMNSESIASIKKQIGDAQKSSIGFHADTRVGTEIAAVRMNNHESLKNLPVEQAHGSDIAMSTIAEQMKSVLDAHHANTSGMSAAEFKTMAKQAFAGATINSGIPSGTTMGQLSTDPRYIDRLSQSIGDQTAKAFKRHGMAPKIENTAHLAPPTITTQSSTTAQPPTYVAPPPNLTAQPQTLRSTPPLNLAPPSPPPKTPPHDIV